MGYDWLLSKEAPIRDDHMWKWIWRLGIPEKIKTLIWLILHEAIPTNLLRRNRHLTHTAMCCRCSMADESILHCLRDCTMPRKIWAHVGFGNDASFWSMDLRLWVSVYSHAEIISPKMHVLFLCTIWWIWRDRNEELFEGRRTPMMDIIHRVQAMVHVCENVFLFNKDTHRREVRWVSWQAPSLEKVKLNVDGSSLGNPGRAGFGGIIRNSQGLWLGGFCGYIGAGTNIKAELFAIRNGLQACWDRGFKNLICETDSLEAIQLIKNADVNFHRYGCILSDIRHLMSRGWHMEMKHVLREANQGADFMAKKGSQGNEGWSFYEQPLPEVLVILLADRMAIAFPRL